MKVVLVQPYEKPIIKDMNMLDIINELGQDYQILKHHDNVFMIGNILNKDYNCTINNKRITGPIICVRLDSDQVLGLDDILINHYMSLDIFNR